MNASDLTKSEVSKKSGVSAVTMGRWERGGAPNIETIEKVLEALGYRLEVARIPPGQPSNREIQYGKK